MSDTAFSLNYPSVMKLFSTIIGMFYCLLIQRNVDLEIFYFSHFHLYSTIFIDIIRYWCNFGPMDRVSICHLCFSMNCPCQKLGSVLLVMASCSLSICWAGKRQAKINY